MEMTLMNRLLITFLISIIGMPVTAQDAEWYLEVGAGFMVSDTLRQAGFNGDNICYPTNACANQPTGYRWFYDLDADVGSNLEAAVGRSFGKYRLEIAASNRKSDLNQLFDSISHLDGSTLESASTDNYSYSDETRIDSISASSLTLNIYMDLPLADLPVDPYIGAGAGLSRAKLSGLYFSSRYECVREPCDAEYPASFYNSHQVVNLMDTVLNANVSAGVDWDVREDISLGLKLSYVMTGNLKQQAGYINHPISGIENTTKISEMSRWSLTVRLRYWIAR
ncbi:MAG: outer membrane beta-barrel protein [Gammaproteobacteria bacterium]|nr:outer membrane beta-barrel protein [Gammaproteobacteria bacterium]